VHTYHISVNGQEYEVEIEDPRASPVTVRVNGQSFQVDVSERQPAQVSAPAPPESQPALALDTYAPAVTVTYQEVELEEQEDSSDAAPAKEAVGGAVAVNAPMPGTILDIAVKVGQQVAEGDTLCNLEAMKMKSPIRAPGDATVAQVLITEGQNVGYGELLFTLN
jgi:biotin carboxyl carrier protein